MNDKEILSEHGRFWLSENDGRKLWGTLRINEINEVRLETFGSLISENLIQNILFVDFLWCYPVRTILCSQVFLRRVRHQVITTHELDLLKV